MHFDTLSIGGTCNYLFSIFCDNPNSHFLLCQSGSIRNVLNSLFLKKKHGRIVDKKLSDNYAGKTRMNKADLVFYY